MKKPKSTRKANREREELITSNDLAALLDLSAAWVRKLARDKIIVRAGRDAFDLKSSVRGYITYLTDRASPSARPDVVSLQTARANEIEQRVAQRASSLIVTKAASEVLDDIVEIALREIDALPAAAFPRDARERRHLQTVTDQIRASVLHKLDEQQARLGSE